MPRRPPDDDLDEDDDDDLPEGVYHDDEDDDDRTVPCPHCREPVYEDATYCPRCENYISKEDAPTAAKPTWVWVCLLLALAGAVLWVVR